jgi:hypothetical protein
MLAPYRNRFFVLAWIARRVQGYPVPGSLLFRLAVWSWGGAYHIIFSPDPVKPRALRQHFLFFCESFPPGELHFGRSAVHFAVLCHCEDPGRDPGDEAISMVGQASRLSVGMTGNPAFRAGPSHRRLDCFPRSPFSRGQAFSGVAMTVSPTRNSTITQAKAALQS